MPARLICTSSAFALMLSGSAGLAEVTAQQVWTDWQAYMAGFGYDMTGTETVDGDTLNVADVNMVFDMPEDEGQFSMTMGNLSFTETGNGSVNVLLPAEMPINFSFSPPEGEAIAGTILYKQDAPVMVVSGEPNDMTYTYSSSSLSMSMEELVVDGEKVPAEGFTGIATMTDVSNVTRMTLGETRDYSQDMSVADLSYELSFVSPNPAEGRGSITGTLVGLGFSGAGSLPLQIDATDFDQVIAQGFSFTGGATFAGGNSDVNATSPDGDLIANTFSDGGTLKFSMGEQGLIYDVSQSALQVNMQVPDFPFPVTLEMAKAAFNMQMPIVSSDEDQDFAVGFTMGDFIVSDVIWNLIDPAAQLPRDPATLALDLTGKAQVLLNFFNPDDAERIDQGMAPGQVKALNINDIVISAVGAKVSGNGAFTFDNTDTTTFQGVPRPEGALNVRVEGANNLIDTLVNMGLLPQEQAMGARMMMGLFGVAEGADVMTSTIEVNEQGHLLANGQRLQ